MDKPAGPAKSVSDGKITTNRYRDATLLHMFVQAGEKPCNKVITKLFSRDKSLMASDGKKGQRSTSRTCSSPPKLAVSQAKAGQPGSEKNWHQNWEMNHSEDTADERGAIADGVWKWL